MPQRRRGIFGRILDFFTGQDTPERPEQPTPQPASDAGTPAQRQAAAHERAMQDTYRHIRGLAHDRRNLTEYQDWRDTFDHLSVIFDSDEEIEEGWDEYLRAFYLTTDEDGHITRQDFYNMTGIPKSQIEWDLWRALKRGTT